MKDNFFQNIQREEKDIYVFYYNRASSLTFMSPPYHIYAVPKSAFQYNIYIYLYIYILDTNSADEKRTRNKQIRDVF